jgi:hypothetical protein
MVRGSAETLQRTNCRRKRPHGNLNQFAKIRVPMPLTRLLFRQQAAFAF